MFVLSDRVAWNRPIAGNMVKLRGVVIGFTGTPATPYWVRSDDGRLYLPRTEEMERRKVVVRQ